MQKLVSTLAGIILLVSMSIVGTPGPTHAADVGDMPAASWPRTITANDATIVVYQPQAIAWKEYRTLAVRMAVAGSRAAGAVVAGSTGLEVVGLVVGSTAAGAGRQESGRAVGGQPRSSDMGPRSYPYGPKVPLFGPY